MKKTFCFLVLLWFSIPIPAQNADTVRLLFLGDIMGHDSQIESAYDKKTKRYQYDSVFKDVKPLLSEPDFTIGNLELTLAGSPYTGYPVFSSPDALAVACKKSGMDVLVTSNNHSCDKGQKGILRTLEVLDSLGIRHTGTFRSAAERRTKNLLILHKKNIRLGILNYTYGTNGIRIPKRVAVNTIDTSLMAADIARAKRTNIDKLIVFIHWGNEYQSIPSNPQKKLAKFLFQKGVDIIIGAHPHVIQPMEYYPQDSIQQERFIAYSLGNFVSGQRGLMKEGGATVTLELVKEAGKTHISDCYYHLLWVNKPSAGNQKHYQILPAAQYDTDRQGKLTENAQKRMKNFLKKVRSLLKKENHQVVEKR